MIKVMNYQTEETMYLNENEIISVSVGHGGLTAHIETNGVNYYAKESPEEVIRLINESKGVTSENKLSEEDKIYVDLSEFVRIKDKYTGEGVIPFNTKNGWEVVNSFLPDIKELIKLVEELT